MNTKLLLALTLLLTDVILCQNLCKNSQLDFELYELKFNEEKIDSCGDARLESIVFNLNLAILKKVVNLNEVLIELININSGPEKTQTDNKLKTFILAGINTDSVPDNLRKMVKSKMSELLLGNQIEILSTDPISNNVIKGLLIYKNNSINYSLLKNGFAEVDPNNQYDLGSWTRCQFKKAVEEAILNKIGVWQTQ